MSLDPRIQHLWNAAQAINGDNHVKKLLKSHYLLQCSRISKKSVQTPKEYFGAAQMCSRCFRPWHDNEFQMKVKTGSPTLLDGKARKLLKKYKTKKDATQKIDLTRSQQKRAKWLRKAVKSQIELTCNYCKHKTKVELEKPKKKLKKPETVEQNVVEQHTLMPKPKKQKKKDKTAGLKIELPIKNTSKNEPKTKVPDNSNPKPQTTAKTVKVPPAPNKPPAQLSKVPKLTLNPPKISQNQPLPNKKPKKNKKAAESQAAQLPPVKKSKTQQQNTILQLAALLKKQSSSKTSENTAASRLHAFLQ